MGKLSGIELKRARLVPSAVFASPADVVRAGGLSSHAEDRDLAALGVRCPAAEGAARRAPRRADPEPSSTGSGQAGGCYPGRMRGKACCPINDCGSRRAHDHVIPDTGSRLWSLERPPRPKRGPTQRVCPIDRTSSGNRCELGAPRPLTGRREGLLSWTASLRRGIAPCAARTRPALKNVCSRKQDRRSEERRFRVRRTFAGSAAFARGRNSDRRAAVRRRDGRLVRALDHMPGAVGQRHPAAYRDSEKRQQTKGDRFHGISPAVWPHR